MNKILPIIIVGIFVLSGLGAVAVKNDLTINDDKTEVKSEIITSDFSSLAIEEYDSNYVDVSLDGISTFLMNPGDPVLPKVVETIELPFGVRNVKVEVTVNNVNECNIEKEIRPAPPVLPLIETEEDIVIESEKNDNIYSSEEPFPSNWYSYYVGCGLNDKNVLVTFVPVSLYPVKYSPKLNKLFVAENAEIKITYDSADINLFSTGDKYDMVIIAPAKFSRLLNKLVAHKNNVGVKTFLKTTESIYKEFEGRDKPEQIKYFIKSAIENNSIEYVLLVGGLKNKVWSEPRENCNYGASGWEVPVRYHNFYDNPEHPLSFAKIHDPGVISDLYYADVYKAGGIFNDWDPNGDGIIAAWNYPDKNVSNDTGLDLYPDVILGRLACSNTLEVRNVVNKIINYEKNSYGETWFKKMVVVSGDGFMDQEDLDIQWNTGSLPNGNYTIIGQSRDKNGVYGPPDTIHITINKNVPSYLSFNHDDYLRITEYPGEPIAEIVSVSEGNILGFNDSTYVPDEGLAYGNLVNGWANINYTDGILHIRGKTYNPEPYGNVTDIHVIVVNENEEIVFEDWRYNQEMYFEGEWVTGEKALKGGGGALYYMPNDFEKEILWASNGKLTGPDDIISALTQGCGFAFLSGHGSPVVWTDHFPGIPGNRAKGSIPSLFSILYRPKKFPLFPVFPLNDIKNKDKLPVMLIGGCHNSQFNVSMVPSLFDKHNEKNTWCHGTPTPECFSWYLVKMPRGGAIATIGNTGLGYGVPGKDCLIEGLDGGICIEFFKQYGIEYNSQGYGVLGNAYKDTLTTYVNTFDVAGNLDHAKSLTQWELLGDPSLRIGGYP
jgi:hypothetical protein